MYQQEKLKQAYTNDLSELSDISYGLLNIDEWASLLSKAVSKKMDGFSISQGDEATIKKEISGFLTTTIEGLEERYKKENQGSGLTALFRRSLTSFSGIFDQIKKDIPVFTDEVYKFLTEAGSAQLIEEYFASQLKEYTKDTFADTDYSLYNSIIKKYEAENQVFAVTKIEKELQKNREESKVYQWILGLIFILMICFLFIFRKITPIEFLIEISYSLSLLVLGIFLPMIAIDARISEITFQFLGEQIAFNNQVLFYRSKSIMEVVDLLFIQNRFDLIFVGFLILLFSVLFPLSKLISSVFYAFGKKFKEKKLIKFMVFKTGKWSMADVFVIALFMAYLGFDGILSDQLNQLQYTSDTVNVISTNKSDLLFGFYAFTAFVLLSLCISQRIKKLK